MMDAISPLDGRYSSRVEPLSQYFSEAALQRKRTEVEVRYLLHLADIDAFPLELSADERDELTRIYEEFGEEDAELVKRIETEGWPERDIPATNHDVKAVEYFIRARGPDAAAPYIHFGLTSEDVTNLAYAMLTKEAVEAVMLPVVRELGRALRGMAQEHAEVPMLAFTHGQPASPTTFGKECGVYCGRLATCVRNLEDTVAGMQGKLAGASGAFNAHVAAAPDIDWEGEAASFVDDLGLAHVSPTTQVKPRDDYAALFHRLRELNNVLIDLDRDMWLYVSRGYLEPETVEGEVGSSTMPHKVNPIDFENAEGNLSKANADLDFLASYLTNSRMQRDLSDSTVMRNVGVALGHALLGYQKTLNGLEKVKPAELMEEELAEHPEILGEAIQTILRREGYTDAYERVKDATRGQALSRADIDALIDDLEAVDEEVRERLTALEPETYIGRAPELAMRAVRDTEDAFAEEGGDG